MHQPYLQGPGIHDLLDDHRLVQCPILVSGVRQMSPEVVLSSRTIFARKWNGLDILASEPEQTYSINAHRSFR